MKQLPCPNLTQNDSYQACVNGVLDQHLEADYLRNQNNVNIKCTTYLTNAPNGTLCNLPQTPHQRGVDPIVSGTSLKKSQLTSLYSDYMVPAKSPARDSIYDNIKVAANGKCPYCGGIGHVRTLDHYLAKAHYPEFSILPANLVPSCRDCNMGAKGASTTGEIGKQILHPYFDAQHFFDEQWVYGTVSVSELVICTYAVIAPSTWTPTDKQRVQSHFTDFDLALRYQLESTGTISTVINSRKITLNQLSSNDFKSVLLDGASDNSFNVNHWSRVLYQALANNAWFCQNAF
jgi:5-methylcytosine-specific restriction endonuclease McrA